MYIYKYHICKYHIYIYIYIYIIYINTLIHINLQMLKIDQVGLKTLGLMG